MSTLKLYQQNVYLQECRATAAAVSGDLVLLDQTVFFPVGGGQSCDLGTIEGLPVTEVFEDNGQIWHRIDGADQIKKGQEVFCRIDWARRFDNMQRHCGEHILSGICYREFGGINRGFHMGQSYMTIDISLEQEAKVKEITWEMAKKAELYTNQVIWADAPVTVRYFDTREEAAKMPLRKPLAIDDDISIVCVGDPDQAADCVACCGTHPSSAGQVGLVKIYKVEHYKGMYRFYFEAGRRALLDYQAKHDLVTWLGNRFSAGPDDLAEKILAREDRARAVKDELHQLRQSVIEARVMRIKEDLTHVLSDSADGAAPATAFYAFDDMKTEDLLRIGKAFAGKTAALLLIFSVQDNTLLLFSDGAPERDCGRLVKEKAPLCGGRGGGSPVSARAIFTGRADMEAFVALVRGS